MRMMAMLERGRRPLVAPTWRRHRRRRMMMSVGGGATFSPTVAIAVRHPSANGPFRREGVKPVASSTSTTSSIQQSSRRRRRLLLLPLLSRLSLRLSLQGRRAHSWRAARPSSPRTSCAGVKVLLLLALTRMG